MTLRTRTLILIGTTLVTLILVLNFVLRIIILNSFTMLENQQIINELEVVDRLLQIEASSFSSYLEDWAYWDDTYDFVVSRDENYVIENLNRTALRSLRLSAMIFVNNAGDLVHAVGYDTEGNPMPTPILAEFYNQAASAITLNSTSSFAGYVPFLDGVILLAGRPILDSFRQSDSRGTLIWARILDEATIYEYGALINHQFMLLDANQPVTCDDQTRLPATLASGADFLCTEQSEDAAEGYALFDDLHGSPAMVMRVVVGREVYAQGQDSLSWFLLVTIGGGALLCLCIIFILDRFVLRPVMRLSHEVRLIAAADDFTQRVTVRGDDEMAHLGRGVNHLLKAVELSSAALKLMNTELEDRVLERTAELEEKNIQLARMQQQKDEFFARASHELRTPLTNIITRLYLLERQPDQVAAHLRVLKSVSTYMRDLLNELLDMSRIQRGALVLNRTTVELQEVVRGVIEVQRPDAESKHILLRAEMQNSPLYVSGDSKRLTQIVTNLINNAIHYTPTSGMITVQVFRIDENEGAFSVRDNGIGIAEEHIGRLFEPFFRAREEISTGTGLGLSIVAELVRLHNGSISVESRIGDGSVFTVRLPLLDVRAGEMLSSLNRIIGDSQK